jgi:hypothetical protein
MTDQAQWNQYWPILAKAPYLGPIRDRNLKKLYANKCYGVSYLHYHDQVIP